VAKPPKPAETESEAERLAAEQAEVERLAAEQAEQERLAAERAEVERLAAEQAEQERLAVEQAQIEAARIAAERAADPVVPGAAREDVRSAIAAFYNISEAEILDWNVETGNVVTIDGRKLTPDARA